MRKTLFPLLVVLLCLGGCKKQAGPMQVAEEYYGMLVRGDVDSYLCGMADYESMPDDYRSQLRDMFLDYLDREQRLKQGLVGVRALRDTLIGSDQAHVFLEVTFADSTREQVTLPLVKTTDGWRMR